LTGSQASGDAYVRACLEALVDNREALPRDIDPRIGLYRLFHTIWASAHVDVPEPARQISRQEEKARHRLTKLAPESRQALLLTAMEGFSPQEAAAILRTEPRQISVLVDQAVAEIDQQTRTRVLIIEDEPIVAMDLEGIVGELGHEVTSVARTHREAVAAAAQSHPGLILADIMLADGSSGVDAVHDILRQFEVPVIFITAFPERLLTGERPEPTFLIAKPFDPATVKATISQALFFDEAARTSG
jgi:CheY-like chemotaxis protein